MTALTLEALGLTSQEITDRIVDRYVEQLRLTMTTDEDGDPVAHASAFDRAMQKRIADRIDAEVTRLAEAHVLPKIPSMVENLTLQETTRWGAPVGEPVSFIDYLVKKAEEFITEKVDFQGRAKGQDSFSWNGTQTRISHMVHQHLHYEIEKAMKQALANANAVIVGGLEQAVKTKLAEVAASLKVDVKTK